MEPFAPITGIGQQISPIQALTKPAETLGVEGAEEGGKNISFSQIIASQLNAANSTLNDSSEMTKKLIAGEVKNPHDVAIAGQKAQIMLKLTTSICSKVSSACTTLFQMQI